MTEKKYGRRDVVKTGAAAAAGATFLAGCGGSPEENNGQGSGEDQEPELKDVNLMLEPGSETADFTEQEKYGLGLTAELKYSNGETETKEGLEYEVEKAKVRKTSEDGKTGDEEGYGVLNGIGENLDFTKFTDEDLKKAGHLYQLQDLEIQDGQIIFNSDDLITGYSQIDLDINVTDQEIGEYVGTYEDQQVLEVNKPEEQALQDLQVEGPEAVELWQKFREIKAETVLDKIVVSTSNEFDNLSDFQDEVEERVNEQLADEDNPTLREELAHWGTQFGRLYMETNNGAAPSGATGEIAHMLAETAFHTSDINLIPGMISDSGHNSNPVFVPGSLDPRDKEYWEEGTTYNVNTQLEDAAHPPDQLVNYTRGPYGIIFKNPEKDPSHAVGTVDSFMELSQGLSGKEGMRLVDEEYAISLTDELGDDTELWHDNLQHIMETAVGNLFSTEHDLIPTGSAKEPEVELR